MLQEMSGSSSNNTVAKSQSDMNKQLNITANKLV